MVVVLPPALDRRSSILQAGEPIEVQAVLSELPVETLYECVLSRLARLDEMQFHTRSFSPEEHRLAGELRAVVANNRFGKWTVESIKLTSDSLS